MLNYYDHLLHLLVFQQLDHPARLVKRVPCLSSELSLFNNTLSNNRGSWTCRPSGKHSRIISLSIQAAFQFWTVPVYQFWASERCISDLQGSNEQQGLVLNVFLNTNSSTSILWGLARIINWSYNNSQFCAPFVILSNFQTYHVIYGASDRECWLWSLETVGLCLQLFAGFVRCSSYTDYGQLKRLR